MPLPTLALSYQFGKINQGFTASGSQTTDAQTVMLAFVNSLLGQTSTPWTCAGSSNSSTSNMTGTNLWSTATNLVWASGAHSWIALKQTGAHSLYLLIDLASGSSYQVTCYVSFVGFTGGSATAHPTATDQQQIFSGSWSPTTSQNMRLHVWSSTDGSQTHMTLWSVNTLYWAFECKTVLNPISTWSLPVVVGMQSALSYATICGAASLYGYLGSTWCQFYLSSECYGNSPIANTQNFPDDDTGEYEFLPFGLYTLTSGHRGRKGQCYDWWAGLFSNNNGDNYPSTGTLYQFVQFGIAVYPWDGATPPAIS